jgi:hypothetical protein
VLARALAQRHTTGRDVDLQPPHDAVSRLSRPITATHARLIVFILKIITEFIFCRMKTDLDQFEYPTFSGCSTTVFRVALSLDRSGATSQDIYDLCKLHQPQGLAQADLMSVLGDAAALAQFGDRPANRFHSEP